MEITNAKLIEKYDTATFGASGFKKREFVVEFAENPEYPEFVKFELIQDKCEQLDPINIGGMMDVSFQLKGRKWTNPKGEVVYFNALQAWKIKPVSSHGGGQGESKNEFPVNNEVNGPDDESLPF